MVEEKLGWIEALVSLLGVLGLGFRVSRVFPYSLLATSKSEDKDWKCFMDIVTQDPLLPLLKMMIASSVACAPSNVLIRIKGSQEVLFNDSHEPPTTWTPKVCKIIAFWAILMGLGPLFQLLFGSR